MRVLLVGSGGREHAIAWCLSKSTQVEKIYVAPGNGGTPLVPKTENIPFKASDFDGLVKFAVENKVDLVIPGPEQPLVDGIKGAFNKVGIPCFGPSKHAAALEGSKAFSKDFMKKHHIPTAEYQIFTEFDKAKAYIDSAPFKVVIKASGLAAGKGVILPESKQEAIQALTSIMIDQAFGDAGKQVVIEERLEGEEVSVLAFSDGYTIVPFPAAQDHKRAFEQDQGPNTGGMGAYAPAPVFSTSLQETVERTILTPTIRGMRRDGHPFVGILYAGLMLTDAGPKVLEYNCRFGDPETQVILPLLSDECDLAEIMLACAEGRLDSVKVSFKTGFAATVVLAAGGYPNAYKKGDVISFPNQTLPAIVFHAGTQKDGNSHVTAGGRVLAVTGMADSLDEALSHAYSAISQIKFQNMHFRKDIGYRALQRIHSTKNAGMSYADAGVSIDNGNLLVEKIKPLVKATRRSGADADLGGFGGLFDLKAAGYSDPVLVSGTDGVGTKLKIAHQVGKHDTIGIDLVAMSVNDVLVQGAEPLFFLDYFACSKLQVDVAKDVVAGIASACVESGCALIGGETAEMPGLYAPGDYDLAGFVVGAVERTEILPRLDEIQAQDYLIGLKSSGVHSNGYSLVRRVVSHQGLDYFSPCPFETKEPMTLGEALLTPTRLYVKPLLPIIRKKLIKGMAHITGGGFTENIPRVLPDHLGVQVDLGSYSLPPVFQWLKRAGNISRDEMARTFNCGIGMVLVVSPNHLEQVEELLRSTGETPVRLGRVIDKFASRVELINQWGEMTHEEFVQSLLLAYGIPSTPTKKSKNHRKACVSEPSKPAKSLLKESTNRIPGPAGELPPLKRKALQFSHSSTLDHRPSFHDVFKVDSLAKKPLYTQTKKPVEEDADIIVQSFTKRSDPVLSHWTESSSNSKNTTAASPVNLEEFLFPKEQQVPRQTSPPPSMRTKRPRSIGSSARSQARQQLIEQRNARMAYKLSNEQRKTSDANNYSDEDLFVGLPEPFEAIKTPSKPPSRDEFDLSNQHTDHDPIEEEEQDVGLEGFVNVNANREKFANYFNQFPAQPTRKRQSRPKKDGESTTTKKKNNFWAMRARRGRFRKK